MEMRMPYGSAVFTSLSAPAHPNPNHDEDQQRRCNGDILCRDLHSKRNQNQNRDQRAAVIRAQIA